MFFKSIFAFIKTSLEIFNLFNSLSSNKSSEPFSVVSLYKIFDSFIFEFPFKYFSFSSLLIKFWLLLYWRFNNEVVFSVSFNNFLNSFIAFDVLLSIILLISLLILFWLFELKIWLFSIEIFWEVSLFNFIFFLYNFI